PLHDPAWDQLWAAAAEHRSFVLLHPWRARSPAGISGLRLGDIVDNPAQSTAVVGALVLAGALDRFPDLRICVVHGGGFLPYQAGRFDAIAPDGPGSALRRLYYDSLTHSPEALSWLVAFAGADHVLLGSDFPFPTGDDAAVRTVERAALTPTERAAVLGGTASQLSLTPRESPQ
ncbi:MAG: amidohydrolase family protein, partial [Pseudonocardia sp.]